jgi:kinesin family protein 22
VEAAVEAEVARRLAEQEKQRLEETNHETIENSKTDTMPSGVLLPLLERHKDLDSELMARLQELERK